MKAKMKHIELYVVIVILVALALLVTGCAPNKKMSSLDELVQPRTTDTLFAQKWVNLYGDKPESVEHYNIALHLRILYQQDARIEKLEEKIKKMEERDAEIKELEKELAEKVKKIEELKRKENCFSFGTDSFSPDVKFDPKTGRAIVPKQETDTNGVNR